MSAASKSIHALHPLEVGGTVARHGFAVQDHVAAGHCLDMINDPSLTQVWCETQDDVTLIWLTAENEEVEFVQVKSNEFDQLWSIAKLLEKEKATESDDEEDPHPRGNGKTKKKEGQCILEKSLQYDRCQEKVRFRVVTSRPAKDELKYLTYELDSPQRDQTKEDYIHLLAKINEKLAHIKSENGNDCAFWLERTFWMWVHSIDAIRTANILKTTKLVEAQGQYLAIDQVGELYQRLLTKVFDGGLAKWDRDAQKKKILRTDLITWFTQAVNDAVHPGQLGTGKKLEDKLRDAGVPEDQFESIAYMRLQYRTDGLTPKYAEASQRKRVEGEIAARLLSLRSKLDGGILMDDGVTFHAKCLNIVDEVYNTLPEQDRPPIQNLYGYMYNLADRCTHRFVRAKT